MTRKTFIISLIAAIPGVAALRKLSRKQQLLLHNGDGLSKWKVWARGHYTGKDYKQSIVFKDGVFHCNDPELYAGLEQHPLNASNRNKP